MSYGRDHETEHEKSVKAEICKRSIRATGHKEGNGAICQKVSILASSAHNALVVLTIIQSLEQEIENDTTLMIPLFEQWSMVLVS